MLGELKTTLLKEKHYIIDTFILLKIINYI